MGLKPAEVLDMTAREFTAYAVGVTRRQEADWRRSLWTAWHVATFTRAKRIPDLKKIMQKIGRRVSSKPKTPQELLKIAERINAMMGGEDRRKKKAD